MGGKVREPLRPYFDAVSDVLLSGDDDITINNPFRWGTKLGENGSGMD